MKLTPTQLRRIIMEEIESTIAEAPRGKGTDKFWTVAPVLEQLVKTRLTALASRPNLGDASYRAQLLAACEEVVEMLQQLS